MRILAARTGWVRPTVFVALLLGAAPVLASSEWVFAVAKLARSLPIYVAEANGYFKAEKLELKIVDCEIGRQCLDRLLNGQAALATSADSPIVFASLRGAKFSILATIARTQNYSKIVTRRGFGITSVADLRGKRVGTFVGSSAHYFLELSLLSAAVDPSSVEIIPIQPDSAVQLLTSGAIDAMAVFDPQALNVVKAQALQALVLPVKRLNAETWNIVTTSALNGPRDAELQGLCRALDRAVQFIAGNPQLSRSIMQARLGLDQAASEQVLKDIKFVIDLRQSLITGLEGQARWAIRERHAVGTLPNFLNYVRPDPLAQVRASAVSVVR